MGQLSLVTGSLATLALPSNVLRQLAAPVPDNVTPDTLRPLIAEMLACLATAGGVGIAAPQVGVLWRLFVLHSPTSTAMPQVFLNPLVVDLDDQIEEGREGCLSIPGYISDRVPRARRVQIEALDHRLERVLVTAEERVARAIQHEYDHLDGILFIDRLASVEHLEPVEESVWLRKMRMTVETMYEEAPVAQV